MYQSIAPLIILAVALIVPRTLEPKPIEVPQPKPPTQRIETITTPTGPIEQFVFVDTKYQPPPRWMPWWQTWRRWIYGGASVLLLLWTLLEIWRYRRRRSILQRDREERQRPPHRLALTLAPHDSGLLQDSTLAGAARWFRQREAAANFVIDLPAIIREAVRRAGFVPGFLERRQTREPGVCDADRQPWLARSPAAAVRRLCQDSAPAKR